MEPQTASSFFGGDKLSERQHAVLEFLARNEFEEMLRLTLNDEKMQEFKATMTNGTLRTELEVRCGCASFCAPFL